MIVNDMVKTYGYAHDRLSHFNFAIYNPETEDWINIPHPNADEYIFLCDRELLEWTESFDEDNAIDIVIRMKPEDLTVFRKHVSQLI